MATIAASAAGAPAPADALETVCTALLQKYVAARFSRMGRACPFALTRTRCELSANELALAFSVYALVSLEGVVASRADLVAGLLACIEQATPSLGSATDDASTWRRAVFGAARRNITDAETAVASAVSGLQASRSELGCWDALDGALGALGTALQTLFKDQATKLRLDALSRRARWLLRQVCEGEASRSVRLASAMLRAGYDARAPLLADSELGPLGALRGEDALLDTLDGDARAAALQREVHALKAECKSCLAF